MPFQGKMRDTAIAIILFRFIGMAWLAGLIATGFYKRGTLTSILTFDTLWQSWILLTILVFQIITVSYHLNGLILAERLVSNKENLNETYSEAPSIYRWLAVTFYNANWSDSLTMVFCILYATSILMNFDLWNNLWSTFQNGAKVILSSFIYYFIVMFGLIMLNFALYGGYKQGFLSIAEAMMSTL